MANSKSRARTSPNVRASRFKPDRQAEPVDTEAQPRLPFPVVAIGGSAGGLEAFIQFFDATPADTGIAFVVVQHLTPERESMVAEIISRHTSMLVSEVADGTKISPNSVHIIRPGRTLTLRDGRLRLGKPVEQPPHRRPVDDFFRSLAEEQRERAICVLMSGMGSNGTAGAQMIKAVGGICIAQEPVSAKFPSMPQALIDARLADFVLPPAEIPGLIVRYTAHPYVNRASVSGAGSDDAEQQTLKEILSMLRVRHDFSGYKTPTLLRRVQRRMGLNQITDVADYARLLRQHPAEVAALADDMMIHVTGFFRDPDSWEAFREKVIEPLVAERADHAAIRAWATACSSGEEAYTLAMLLVEAAEAAKKHIDIKIFATDTAERSLAQSRAGLYPGGIESEVSPARLERFFDREDANYRVKKELRELVVFAPQNLLEDPPFSHLDICTCRNLLIYLEPEVQRRAISLLHFGLREGGALFLGTSETATGGDDLFEPIDKKHRIFRRIGPTRHGSVDFPFMHSRKALSEGDARAKSSTRGTVAQITTKTLLERFGPPSVVIDRHLHIVYFHGNTGRYLDQPRGEPTRELLSLVREPVRGAVRTAVQHAMTQNETVTTRDGFSGSGEERRRTEISVIPLDPSTPSALFLVAFNDVSAPEAVPLSAAEDREMEYRELSSELQRARDELQSTIEELQASNEELKASNEELETSKEELQSLNEELTTVNAQLQAKMEELESTTNDLSSLLSSTDIAVLFLDTALRIRRFTPAVNDLFDLIPSDTGRPLRDLARKFDDPDLLTDAQGVLRRLVPVEKEIISESRRVYMRRVLPYRTSGNRIDGIVITFIDISRLRRAESALGESEERYRVILDGIQEYAIFMLDPAGRIATWTPAAERILGYNQAEVLGKTLAFLFDPKDVAEGLDTRLIEEAKQSGVVRAEHWHLRKDGTRFWGGGILSRLRDDNQRLVGFAKVLRDNTDRKLAEESLREAKRAAEEANEAKDQFLANVSHELRTPLSCLHLWAMLLEEQEDVSPEMLREGLDMIKKSAQEQRELIEDLVDTARIAAGKLELERTAVEFSQIVGGALDVVRGTADEKKISLSVELDPSSGLVHADAHRLQQVVWNLLSNAVKFTPEGGRIDLTVKRRGGDVEIRVSDTGIGINADFLPHVFDRFGQQDRAAGRRQSGGLGLGLAIARHIVELHGGTITAESPGRDRGAVFTVSLPLPIITDAVAPEVPPVVPLDGALAGVSILLVEDADDTRRAVVAVLHEAGATVTETATADAAMHALKDGPPDLIVCDIGLPDIDGCNLITQIRAWEKDRDVEPVPALAFTAFAGEKSTAKIRECGFQDCLTKPVEPAHLIAALVALRTGTTK